MIYNHKEIEKKWQKFWDNNKTFVSEVDNKKEKFYSLDMFPYPSGAGLHVGHPLGYIASDIYSRYMRLLGYNVLHPMGFDSFGLPAEQYAIQTGKHPQLTTNENIDNYINQLKKIGFSFDWDRTIKTSDHNYYKWTQWIFSKLFDTYYCNDTKMARPISELIKVFESEGNIRINASTENIIIFDQKEWKNYNEKVKNDILMAYRMAFLSESTVNWCPELETVLANDEIKNGRSERGNHPVFQKKMTQWSLRITAYAERLLNDLNQIDWSDSLKEHQRNWIGKSEGADIEFDIKGNDKKIKIFTSRPDTIFGVDFMVLAPEHDLVEQITNPELINKIIEYKTKSSQKTERDRLANINDISGEFTGAYAIHPITQKELPIWISDYVLISYGTGAIMAVPAGDERDWKFANYFNLKITNIFNNNNISLGANEDKNSILINSDFLNNLDVKSAISKAVEYIETNKLGYRKTNYRLRDAIFSRQRYWGEPFPIYYQNEIPFFIGEENLPLKLPDLHDFSTDKEGNPPLSKVKSEDWEYFNGDKMDYNTMPGWAGSSWYYLRYMDPNNDNEFVSREKSDYWNQVDLYIGGVEHASGHLIYSRFWCKFLFDLNLISFDEPFKKLINQGMILGTSSLIYRLNNNPNSYVTHSLKDNYDTTAINMNVNYVRNNVLDIDKAMSDSMYNYLADADFILEDDGTYKCGSLVEKMSKSKFNVVNPDELCNQYGADTLRCYEMFLGPLEQYKPWDTNGITGVYNFIKKLWSLYIIDNNSKLKKYSESNRDSLKTLHTAIKKITDDLSRFSFNTVVSNLMIAVNEFKSQACDDEDVLSQFIILVSPYAPHISEEIWSLMGNTSSISYANWPIFNPQYLEESSFNYPIAFNGKTKYTLEINKNAEKDEINKIVLEHPHTLKYIGDKSIKKMIIVPNKIVNIVL